MSQLKNRDILINYLSSFVSAGIGFFFLPQYLKYISLEEYGVVGFISALQTWVTLIDFGFPTIISREIAKKKNLKINRLASLFYTIERYYFIVISIILTVGLLLYITNRDDKQNLILQNIIFVLFIVSIRLIENVYKSALIGFEKHLTYNSF